jgi:hypothetical protein
MVIGGKERPVSFTVNALIELREKYQIDIIKGIDETAMSPETIRAIAFVGLKHGARREKVEFTDTIEEVGDMLSLDTIGDLMKSILGQAAKEGKPGE